MLHGLGMDALVIALTGTRTELWFVHGCFGERMLLEHGRNYGLGMAALVITLTGTRTEFWFGHGCSGEPMLVTTGLINVLEVFVSILSETWGRKARPYILRKLSLHNPVLFWEGTPNLGPPYYT